MKRNSIRVHFGLCCWILHTVDSSLLLAKWKQSELANMAQQLNSRLLLRGPKGKVLSTIHDGGVKRQQPWKMWLTCSTASFRLEASIRKNNKLLVNSSALKVDIITRKLHILIYDTLAAITETGSQSHFLSWVIGWITILISQCPAEQSYDVPDSNRVTDGNHDILVQSECSPKPQWVWD